MNKVIFLALLIPLLGLPTTGSGQITENFESGNISRWVQSPGNRWKADTFNSISGVFSLHHSFDNPDAGTDRAGLSLQNLRPAEGTTTWSFKIRYGYEPSSSNNWVVWLMSDTESDSFYEGSFPHGFALGVNQDGYDDTLKLWRVEGERFITVIKSNINWQADIGTTGIAVIAVTRSAPGTWTMTVSNGNELSDISSGYDAGLSGAHWFIICYRYTSSRDMLLWFDDLKISGVFSDEPEIPTSPPARPGDVIFTEVMSDPTPEVSLPAEEYLEICNTSGSDFRLNGWHLSTESQEYAFPDVTFKAGEYLILCKASDTVLFNVYGSTAGFRSFPGLTDAGRALALTDGTGKIIDGISYSSEWYGDELRSQGGWSLEIIDKRLPFSGKENWHASLSATGGSPGAENSVAGITADRYFYGIDNVFPEDSVSLILMLTETVTDLPEKLTSIRVEGKEIKSISATNLLMKKFEIIVFEAFEPGSIYNLSISEDVSDFAGNAMERSSYGFGIPQPPVKGDVRFNELLFNPWPGESDYIELVNCSEKVLDVSDLLLVTVNDQMKDTSDVILLSPDHRCLLPGDFYTVTEEREKVIGRFPSGDPDRIFEISSMPSMPDNNGHILLFNRALELIDEVVFSEKMQFPLLQDAEGVALEKVRPGSLSMEGSFWHSAAESSGWGTPGAPNSIWSEYPEAADKIIMSSGKITPDNDGNEDFLVIDFKMTGTGNVLTVLVFDETGMVVKKLTENMLAGQEASVVWNGTADDGKLTGTGIYILLIRIFDDSGKVRNWKKVCTVIRK